MDGVQCGGVGGSAVLCGWNGNLEVAYKVKLYFGPADQPTAQADTRYLIK